MPKFQLVTYASPAAFAVEITALDKELKPLSKYDHNQNGDPVIRSGKDAPTIFTFPGLVEKPLNTAPEPVKVPVDLWARMKKEIRYIADNIRGDAPLFREVGMCD